MANWVVGEEAYASSTPSRMDSINLADENRSRAKTVLFIEELGLELQCNRIVVATACVFFHRFYCLQSFNKHNRFLIGATCLFLASKVEEEQRKLRDIVAVWMALRKRRGEEVADKETKEVTNKMLLVERILLQTLCFDMQIVHPFSPLLDLIKNLKDYIDQEQKLELRQAAISFINDSLRSPLCLCYDPKHIAVTAFYLATMHINITPINPNPRSLADQSWFELIENHIDEQLLRKICGVMLDVYGETSPTNAFAQIKKARNGSELKGKYDIHTNMNSEKANQLWDKFNAGERKALNGGDGAAVGEDDSGKGPATGDEEAVPPPPMEEGQEPPPPPPEDSPRDSPPPPPPVSSPDGAPAGKRSRLD